MVQKSALLLVGDYVEAYEVMVPFQALLAYGLKVDAVCPGKKAGDSCKTAVHDFLGYQTYSEMPGHNFTLNATFEEVDVKNYDVLVIPGGRAPEYLSINDGVIKLVKGFAALNRPIASICHGQLILAAAGLLKGKKCTAYPAVKPVVEAAGGHWLDPNPISACFTDGNLITGAAWPGHPEFLTHILKALGAKISKPADGKVLFLCEDYMEDYEGMVPFQALQALGYAVDAVCPDKKAGEKCITAIHDFEGDQRISEAPGHNFVLTLDFDKAREKDYDALVIPGGRPPEEPLNEKVLELVKAFSKSNKPIAAICHAQQILASAGLLEGKKCTAYPEIKPLLVDAGAKWREPEPMTKAVTDGKLVTGAAWFAHPEYISQFMSVLGAEVTF